MPRNSLKHDQIQPKYSLKVARDSPKYSSWDPEYGPLRPADTVVPLDGRGGSWGLVSVGVVQGGSGWPGQPKPAQNTTNISRRLAICPKVAKYSPNSAILGYLGPVGAIWDPVGPLWTLVGGPRPPRPPS